MLRKVALALALAVGFSALVESPMVAPPAQAQFYIPCPTIPCPTFDGSNFVKNSLTEMHTLQQMYDTAVIKLQEIQRIKQMIADHQISPDAAYESIQNELASLKGILSQNSEICQNIVASNTYFRQNLGMSVGSPCAAPTTSAAKAQIDNAMAVAQHALSTAQSRSSRTAQLASDANITGIGAEQQAGIQAQLTAQVVNEIQAEESLQAANMQAEGAYYEQAIQHQNKADATQAAARKQWNYFFNGKAVDPQANPTPSP